jgi:hypothetical protein
MKEFKLIPCLANKMKPRCKRLLSAQYLCAPARAHQVNDQVRSAVSAYAVTDTTTTTTT